MSERPQYDLEQRTALFGEAIISFANQIPLNQLAVNWKPEASARQRC
jgi:hypothetical protein